MHVRSLKALIYLLLLSAPVLACEKDCPPFPITSNQIVCACDAKTDIGEPVKPSDEKPRMSGQPVEQAGTVIDQAKPAEATELSSGTFTWIWSETDRGIMPAVK